MAFESTDEFLAHFGVKGMRWGVRRDGEQTTEGLSDRQKKALKVGAGVAVVAGAGVVSVMLARSGHIQVPSRRMYKPNPHAKEASDNFYNNVHRGRRQVENMLKSDTTKLDSILKNQQGQMYRLLEEEQKRMRLLGLDTGR
jgi:hypothetical protein